MKRLLIVEDDEFTATAYQQRFMREGFQVDVASDGESGIEMIYSKKPDVVLLDLMLPKLNGVELLKNIRSQPNFRTLPIIVLSNAFLSDMVQQAWQAGASQIIPKTGHTLKQIVAMVHIALDPHEPGKSPPAAVDPTEPLLPAPVPANKTVPAELPETALGPLPPTPAAAKPVEVRETPVTPPPSTLVPIEPAPTEPPESSTGTTNPTAGDVTVCPSGNEEPVTPMATVTPGTPSPMKSNEAIPVQGAPSRTPAPPAESAPAPNDVDPEPVDRPEPDPVTPPLKETASPPPKADVVLREVASSPKADRPRDWMRAISAPTSPEALEQSTNDGFRTEIWNSFHHTKPEILMMLRRQLHEFVSNTRNTHHLLELWRKVHAIAGDAGLFGFHNLARMASAVEALLHEVYFNPLLAGRSVLRTIVQSIDLLVILLERSSFPIEEGEFKARVLVLDDEDLVCETICRALKRAGLEATSVKLPSVALATAGQNSFDLIFSDMDMPEMNGFEFCTRLRQIPNCELCPVILMARLVDFEFRARTCLLKNRDVIAKPFLETELTTKALTLILKSKLGIATLAEPPAS